MGERSKAAIYLVTRVAAVIGVVVIRRIMVLSVFGLYASRIGLDLDGGKVRLIWMNALLVTLEAIDAFELLVAVGTSPDSLVRVGEEMTA